MSQFAEGSPRFPGVCIPLCAERATNIQKLSRAGTALSGPKVSTNVEVKDTLRCAPPKPVSKNKDTESALGARKYKAVCAPPTLEGNAQMRRPCQREKIWESLQSLRVHQQVYH